MDPPLNKDELAIDALRGCSHSNGNGAVNCGWLDLRGIRRAHFVRGRQSSERRAGSNSHSSAARFPVGFSAAETLTLSH